MRSLFKRPYLLVIANLYCNHKCSYCIQQESSLDVRKNPKRVDVPALLAFLRKNRIDRHVNVMGGEASLHPDFEKLIHGLARMYRKVRLTTNVNGAWYADFPAAIATMKGFGERVQYNTTYHPAWMDADVYIDRIRAMRAAGLNVVQATSTDTSDLTDEMADRLHAADIGWTLQPFTGRGKNGDLLPRTWADVRTAYPLLYDPSWYIDRYEEYANGCEDANHGAASHDAADDIRLGSVQCSTPRFLIGPDNNVYPCHRHLYAEDTAYACGSIHDVRMREFHQKWDWWRARWVLPCHTKCNPCDFGNVKIQPLERSAATAPLPEAVTP